MRTGGEGAGEKNTSEARSRTCLGRASRAHGDFTFRSSRGRRDFPRKRIVRCYILTETGCYIRQCKKGGYKVRDVIFFKRIERKNTSIR